MKLPESDASSHDLDAASAALADAQRIDWSAYAAHSDDTLEGLRLLEDIALAFRDSGAHVDRMAPTDAALFHWGDLHVRASLGRGAVGEVWRAFDPALQRDVALKLRPADAAPGDNAAFLAEARHLARLRHRHVLAVYGVAEHEGRAGLWSELIEGRTLASQINTDGPLPREDALRIGHELASALIAIHGAGLIHGDVKAENVMREAGGRSVLMDFGAAGGSAEVAARSVLQATPRYLPPEVREGRAAPSAAIDLFALGVLLHLLLSGRYPEPQQSLAALRPDLDAPLCALVDAAVANDPAQRPHDAHDFAAQIARLLVRKPHPSRGARTGLALAIVALLVASAALIAPLWLAKTSPTNTAAIAWRVDAAFLDPVANTPRTGADTLKLGDQIALRVATTQPSFVYVLNEDADGRVHLLFPVGALDQGNPLPAQTTVLPGRAHGEEVSWSIDSASSREEFVAIIAPRKLAQLEARLAEFASADITSAAARHERGVAALAPRSPQAPSLAGAHLRELVALAQAELGKDATQLSLRVLAAPQQ